MHSEQINELSAALSKAQGAMKAAVFNRINPHFKNRYADLAAVWDAIRDPLSKNGLAVTQITRSDGNGSFMLRTTLHHGSGQWMFSDYPLPPSGAKPQEMGSALTYARRYSLSAIVGIAPDEDDDANEAEKHTSAQPTKAAIATIEAAKQIIKSPLVKALRDPGDPRALELDEDVDWPWFGHHMIELAATEQWAQWREANMLNMERMKNEARPVYDRMIAGIKNARP